MGVVSLSQWRLSNMLSDKGNMCLLRILAKDDGVGDAAPLRSL